VVSFRYKLKVDKACCGDLSAKSDILAGELGTAFRRFGGSHLVPGLSRAS